MYLLGMVDITQGISGILDADFSYFPFQNISHFSWLYTDPCGFEEKLL